MRILIPVLLAVLTLPVAAKDVYKWTSPDGVIYYSDQFREGAEKVWIPGQSTARSKAGETSEPSEETNLPGESGYAVFEIAEPENDATIRNNEGTVGVGLSLSPVLISGDAIQVFVDGNRIEGDIGGATQFTLNDLSLGTHTLEARILDDTGKLLTSTPTINFHLRKAPVTTP
ncbi:MAG: hypothetical protein DIZ78_18165 [endosymbiont of Escarpia spicata]|uniref:DUF4124 domain-containing protein n=1 Tax=endosymbiont of Escarpia spicata TaxID=2200908 RepID=A0A370D7R1_9GAMM|nr:MAG: hypothetical protein DIZ78_18165 [endosymbiont of Escarpia spicata]